MLTLNLFILLQLLDCIPAQKRSLWKPFQNTPGKFDCMIDGMEAFPYRQIGPLLYCLARIRNETHIYTGYLSHSCGNTKFHAERLGSWFSTDELTGVEVLDVDASLISWIPIALNPPDAMLIATADPFVSYPRKVICRSLAHHYEGLIIQRLGFTKDGGCETNGGISRYESDYEVLALNDRAKLFYDYGYIDTQNVT